MRQNAGRNHLMRETSHDLRCQCADRKSHIEQQIQVIHRQFDEEMALDGGCRDRISKIHDAMKKLCDERRKLERAEVRRAAAKARELRGNKPPKLGLVWSASKAVN
jgi:hypothetical protein